jgi:dipeptidyl aminopeptidase/acylaminoacyl peptidase
MLSLLLAAALAALPAPADSITPADLLDLRTAAVADLSRDGRWLALTVQRRRDGLGVDASRDGDPTYLRVVPVELLVRETTDGAEPRPVFRGTRPVRNATWSPDGSRLAWQELRGDRLVLVVWDRARNRETVAAMPARTYVAENSELRWNGAGTALYFAQRSEAWRDSARARFATLVRGPITHLRGPEDEPFLPWESLRREPFRRAVAEWDLSSGRVRTLLSERMLSTWGVAADGSALWWHDDRTTKTDYTTIGGREERLLARVGSDTTPRVLFPSLRQLSVQWDDAGTRFFYARDGGIWMGRLDASDTARRRLAAPDSVPASDTSAAARDRRAATRWTLVRAAATGDAVIASRRDALYLIDTTGRVTRIAALPDSADRGSPRPSVSAWSGDGRWVYLTANARDRWDRGLLRWDRASGTLAEVARDTLFRTALQVSQDGRVVTLNLAAPNRPAEPYVTDGALAAPRRLLAVNPQLDTWPRARTELLRYLDADGTPQYGVLYRPTTGKAPYPTVFIVYETFFDDTWDATANYLASRGYAVVKPSVSFETGFPGEAWLKGVTAAANHVIELGIADSARLGVHGGSYGGYATNLLITQTKRFKAAINIAGKVDIISFYTDSPRLGTRNTHAAERSQDRIGATLWEAPQKYWEHSAVLYADRITTPLLLMTGGEDHNVPAQNTREMYYALRRLGKTVEWVNYVNGGHGTPNTTAEEFTHFHETMLGWYDRWLKPAGRGPQRF